MSDETNQTSQPAEPTADAVEKRVHGVVAEYTTVDSLLDACRRVRDAGYTKTDAFTPFPVHGIDTALGIKPTVLPWIALAGGLTGVMTALAMQIWMNGIDYPYIISGKPYISLPAFMPVAFELTILFASFGAFFGMWALNGLPKFSNPVFTDPRFDRVTDDRFFLYIDAKDESFDQKGVESLLGDTGSQYINTVVEDDTPTAIPKFLITAIITVIAASIVPALVVAKMRVTNSTSPRFHIFPDMDFSPSLSAQKTTTLFGDNRSMRPDVPGTVARGQLGDTLDFQTGIDMDKLTLMDSHRADTIKQTLVRTYPRPLADKEGESGDAPTSAEASVMDTTPWIKDNPLEIDEEIIRQGQKQFNIYCATCHGVNGRGNGLVNRRARKILAATWIPPSSLHQETLYAEKYPDGKLFNTISNGIRKMPGYAGQITAKDRWSIVSYVRALQASSNATIDQVPDSMRDELKKKQTEVQKALEEQAEAEKKMQEEK